ncbi:hypothetical protein Pcinc_015063 [Petrolisthes cinctipes]|uniref:Uncharacterized protein n=1 Tax=Petrolisthes cinctipes TaxID=88211 RepID=A0AAE1KNK4_PETCI|nr:hypothetical protein Pcinc_015063 [Petrolisthes cinctipes]
MASALGTDSSTTTSDEEVIAGIATSSSKRRNQQLKTSVKKRKTFTQKFRNEWLQKLTFKSWLEAPTKGSNKPLYVVSTAFPLAVNPANILAGFRAAGISPFNRDIFQDSDFMSAYVTDRPQEDVQQETANENSVQQQINSLDNTQQ